MQNSIETRIASLPSSSELPFIVLPAWIIVCRLGREFGVSNELGGVERSSEKFETVLPSVVLLSSSFYHLERIL